MWVKICGNTNLPDAEAAINAGADALGFVFAPSPRQVTAQQVRAITNRLPVRVERYGVFVDAQFEEIVATVDQAGLSGIQLHSAGDPSLATRLREHFSAVSLANGRRRRLGLLQVLHSSPESDPEGSPEMLDQQLEKLRGDHSVDAILIDARSASAPGGTGVRFDWARASGAFIASAPHLRLIAAGGLAPDNIAEAIALLRPWGVDVVTGVEVSPGHKDTAKVREFIQRARATASALEQPAPARS